jgi:PAS domain S-box-containing protein
MKQYLELVFSGDGFMPHGHCYLWTPGLVWLHVISDALIVLAYFSIPLALVYFVRNRKDLTFAWIFVSFAVFILACGTTHLMEIWNVWHAQYWLSGGIKALTALASVPTAILLARLVPAALALPSPAMLTRANVALKAEIQSRRIAEETVSELNVRLEARVAERTADLKAVNEDLLRQIAERKQAERALRESEERFRSYFELGLIGAAITSPTKGWIEVNDEICRMLGYERSELLRMSWAELTHPDDLIADLAHFNRVLAAELDGYSMDKRFIRKDGRVIHATISAKCRRRTDGSVDYFMALLQDITERKQAEQALRESEERFRELAENINEVFWAWTATPGNARLLYVSPAYETIWGRSCESLYSSPRSWMEALHPQDRERILEEGARMGVEKITDWTYRIVRPDQSIRWIRDRIFPVRDAKGAVVRFAGIAEDITERKRAEEALRESEERLQSFFAGATAGLCILDRKLRYVRINETLAEMNGASVAEHLGRSIQEVLPGIAPVLGPLI